MSRSRVARRSHRLAVESLEAREVPANNLSVAGATFDDSNDVKVTTQAQTIRIETLKADAQVSIATIEDALKQTQGNRKQVIVSTAVAPGGTDGNQAGNITWNINVAGNLNFAGFDAGKTLTFRTVAGTNAVGNIDLSGIGFHNGAGNEQIGLAFDTTATNGTVEFHSASVGMDTVPVSFDDESVLDFSVTTGTGSFFFDPASVTGSADAGGSVTVHAGSVQFNNSSGVTAGGDVTVTGTDVSFSFGSGLFATGTLSVIATNSVQGFSGGLTAQAGSVTVSGPSVNLVFSQVEAGTTVDLTGTSSLFLNGGSLIADGDVTLTGGSVNSSASVSAGGNLTVSGTGVGLSGVVSATGDMSITGTGMVSLTGGSSFSAPSITVTGGAGSSLNNVFLDAINDLTFTAPDLSVAFATVQGGTAVTLNAPISLTGDLSVVGGRASTVTFGGTLTGSANLTLSGGTIQFNGSVGTLANPLATFTLARGVADLGVRNLFAQTVSVGDGVIDPLGEATLGGRGKITLTGNGFAGSATLTVAKDGNLAPGGLGGAPGTLTVIGNVDFNGGDLAIDLGTTSDLLVVQDNNLTADVEGNVVIDGINGGRLGGGLGTGALPGNAVDVPLIDYTGDFTGTFTNAPLNTPVLVGTDVIKVTSYDTDPANPGGLMIVNPVAAATGGVVTGSDPSDGTLFTAKLTGGGELLGGTLAGGELFLVARNTTAASVLSVTTRANGSDDIVTFAGGVLINGPLASFTAPRADIGGQFRATGWVKAATFRDLLSLYPNSTNTMIDFGGLATQSTAITVRNLFGSVRTASKLGTLKVAKALGAHVSELLFEDSTVTAPSLGTVTAGSIKSFITSPGAVAAVTTTGTFQGGVTVASLGKFAAAGGTGTIKATGAVGTVTGTGVGLALALDVTAASVGMVSVSKGVLKGMSVNGWNVTNGVAGIRAGGIEGLNLTAKFLGLVTVKATPDTAGEINVSRFTLTGNDGTLNKYGLKGLTASGGVVDSLIDAKDGNVGAVTVGRFMSSALFLNYTPDPTVGFNLGGTFGAARFKLTSFKTTALPTPDPTSPFHEAFANSKIAADTIGTVTLSVVRQDAGGQAFGIKVHSNGAVVIVKAAETGFPANKLNVALNPTTGANPAPVSADFYFLRV
jgi:hypothetical protein